MKKLLFTFILLTIFHHFGYCQFVVSDPANLAVNTAIQSLNEATSLMDQFMAKAEKLKLAVEIFDQVKTVKEITDYLDELVCLTSDLQFNLNYANNYECLTFLNFRSINISIRYATDLMVKVFLTKNLLTMGSGERLGILNNILETLKKTVAEISQINQNIRNYARKRILKRYYAKHMYCNMNGFMRNRYDKK